MSAKRILKFLLRVMGSFSLTAVIFVAAPYSWMNSLHEMLGLGTLPDAPIVGYLARSTSAFYALIGGLFWVLSFDVNRHRQVLIYLGAAFAIFGVALFVIDWAEGLPLMWSVWEGPFTLVFGLVLSTLGRRLVTDAS